MDDNNDNLAHTPIGKSACKMSSSLKKKLRMLGRYHGSPISSKLSEKTQARIPLSSDTSSANNAHQISYSDNSEEPDLSTDSSLTASLENSKENVALVDDCLLERVGDEQISINEPGVYVVAKCGPPADENVSGNDDLLQELKMWEEKVEEKQDLLRKLKLVKLYRSKNNLDMLKGEISLWRTACQNALLEYRDKCQAPAPSLTEIISHMQIDFSLINYNPDENSFVD